MKISLARTFVRDAPAWVWMLRVLIITPAISTSSYSCGFWEMPSAMESSGMDLPGADFYSEIARIPRDVTAIFNSGDNWENTLRAELDELRESLIEAYPDPDAAQKTVDAYKSLRQSIKVWFTAIDDYGNTVESSTNGPFDLTNYASLIASLPEEFALYLEGAVAFRVRDFSGAEGKWKSLLELPLNQRLYRSTWAVFMLGKCAVVNDPTKALECFNRIGELQQQGCRDSLNLQEFCTGWRAKAEMELGLWKASIHHYWQVQDVESLRRVCGALFERQGVSRELVEDALCRRIVTLYALSTNQLPDAIKEWYDVLTQSGFSGPLQDADRLAWAAYNAGDMERAKDWVALASPGEGMTRLIQAKLMLRDGRIRESLELLEQFREQKSEDAVNAHYDTCKLIAVINLGLRRYDKALEACIESRDRSDIAYLVERILTSDEVAEFIRSASPVDANLRELLSRRLVRERRYEEAVEFAADELKSTLKQLDYHIKESGNSHLPWRKRAEHRYDAAMIIRYQGMEIMGTDNDPDWSIMNGQLSLGCYGCGRLEGLQGVDASGPERPENGGEVLHPTKEEKRRHEKSASVPWERFHYRYVASDLMWKASLLLPDNDPLTAKCLWRGGIFLKNRDKEAADRFYKALVRRCRKLPISHEADLLKWFPSELKEESLVKEVPSKG